MKILEKTINDGRFFYSFHPVLTLECWKQLIFGEFCSTDAKGAIGNPSIYRWSKFPINVFIGKKIDFTFFVVSELELWAI